MAEQETKIIHDDITYLETCDGFMVAIGFVNGKRKFKRLLSNAAAQFSFKKNLDAYLNLWREDLKNNFVAILYGSLDNDEYVSAALATELKDKLWYEALDRAKCVRAIERAMM